MAAGRSSGRPEAGSTHEGAEGSPAGQEGSPVGKPWDLAGHRFSSLDPAEMGRLE